MRRWRCLAPLLVLAALIAAAPASAAGGAALRALERQPCPPRYLPGGLKYPYQPEDVVRAREQAEFRITDQYFELVPPIDWRQVGSDSQTFRFALTQLTWTQILLEAYLAGDDGALAQARHILVDFARNQRYEKPGTAPWAWGTKRTGDRATVLSYMVRAGTCEGILTNGDQKALLRAIEEHGDFMLAHVGPTNHALFDGFALGVIAEQVPFMNDARKWRREAKRRFNRTFFSRIKPKDGFWLENSTRYHDAVTSLLERYLSLGFAHPARLQRTLPRMEEVCAWLIEPDLQEVQLGDTWLREAPEECLVLSEGQSGAETLRGSGAAFVREGDSYLAQFAQFFNSTHKHSDDLSFELFDAGHRVITDSGDYHREKDGWGRFMRSARAHSTLTVGGRDFSRSDDDAYGSGIVAAAPPDGATAPWYAIQSRNPLLSERGVDHRRTLLYKPQVALIIVDRVRSTSSRRFRRHLQFGPDFDVEPAAGAEVMQLSAGSDQIALFDSSSKPSSHTVAEGELDPLGGFVSPTFRNAIPRPTVTLETNGRAVDHVATISLDDSRLRASLGEPIGAGGFALGLSDSIGGEGTLTVDRDGRSLEVAESP
jgi:hypothetical protein